jgi:hypothetical protein
MPTSTNNGGVVTKMRPNSVKSFEVAARDSLPDAEKAPLPFDLKWRDKTGTVHQSPPCTLKGCEVEEPHSWHARPWNIPDILLMRIPNMEVDQNSVVLFRVFELALGEDWLPFDKFITSDEVYIDAEQFVPILMWFVEEATGRPTGPS